MMHEGQGFGSTVHIRKEILGRSFDIVLDRELRFVVDELELYTDSTRQRSEISLFVGFRDSAKQDANDGYCLIYCSQEKYSTFRLWTCVETGHLYGRFEIERRPGLRYLISNAIRSIDGLDYKGRIGQELHENVFVPTAFLSEDLAIIHAAGFVLNGTAILITGLGGIGKTSMELYYCLNKGAEFFCDDMAVIGSGSSLLPNYSYPKIYGYNIPTLRNATLKVNILNGLGDSIQWCVRKRLLGDSFVRRRVAPSQLFTRVGRGERHLDVVLNLRRVEGEVPRVRISEIDEMVEVVNDIAIQEYADFYREISVQIKNSGNDKVVDKYLGLLNKKEVCTRLLTGVKLYVVEIPSSFDHERFIETARGMIESVLIGT